MRRLKRVPVGVIYTIAFICLAGVIYSPLFLDGRSLIWTVDGISQHLPILMAFQKMLKGIGSQALFGWSWNLGLGADQMTTFAYYVVGDPFNYLVALFPTNQIEFAYQFLILLRLYVAGLAWFHGSELLMRPLPLFVSHLVPGQGKFVCDVGKRWALSTAVPLRCNS